MKNPVFLVEGENICEVWEKSLLKLYNEGIRIKTEYDKPSSPLSWDCTMIMVVNSPLSEPRIHRALPCGLEDLEIYRLEVIEGIHDHWIKPEEGKWSYTYHERIFNYKIEETAINQIEYIIEKLSKVPYSRRAQAITWNVKKDLNSSDPPCLQRLWFRIEEENGVKRLCLNAHWRSRDAYKAAFMNIFALTDLQKKVSLEISRKTGERVEVGRYVDISDSYHLYGEYFEEFQSFLKNIETRKFSERTWSTEFALPFFEEAKKRVQNEKKL
jgi:thymidylate synthase